MMGCACGSRRTCTDPVIDEVPADKKGEVVVITGSGFAATTQVCYGPVPPATSPTAEPATIVSWTPTELEVVVPYLDTAGNPDPVLVTVCNGSCSASYQTEYWDSWQ